MGNKIKIDPYKKVGKVDSEKPSIEFVEFDSEKSKKLLEGYEEEN